MAAPLRWCLAASLLIGCGDQPSLSETLKKADELEAKRKAEAEAKKKAIKVEKDPNALELPWKADPVKEALEMGTTVEYAVTGTDSKGKPYEDTYFGEVKANNPTEVGVTKYHGVMAKEPVASQVAKLPWGSFSPFFPLEKPEHELVKLESVQVPAGTFDTVVVELRDFFGAHQTVWLIKDKPGIYAKVVDHGNEKNEDDQTELTYALTKVGKR